MKQIILSLLVIFSLSAAAQVDSTRIMQTPTMQQRYVLHFLGAVDWNNTDVINVLNQFRPQYDSVGKGSSTKLITVTVPSGLLADAFYRLSQLPEGQATQYNGDMADALTPYITNPWLGARMYLIKSNNFKIRDERNNATARKVEAINPM